MATSGTTTFSMTRNDLIRQAAMETSAIATGQIMGAQMVQDFAVKMNSMIKHWQGRGIHVWTISEATLFPVAGQVTYSAGTGATDHITREWWQTTLSAVGAAADTVLNLTSTANITASDNIGIVLDDLTVHWTTVSSKTATTATIAAALPSAAASGSRVFNYTTKIERPVQVVDARRYSVANATTTPITLLSTQEYRALPNRAASGSVNQMQYDRQLSLGKFHLWTVPATMSELVEFTWWRPFEVFTAASNNPDLPEEWFNTIMWNLAFEMMGRFPVAPDRRRLIAAKAESTLMDMEGFGRENESISVQPMTAW